MDILVLSLAFLLLGACSSHDRDNPTDPGSDYYNSESLLSSSSQSQNFSSDASNNFSSSSYGAVSCPAYNSSTHFCDTRDGTVYKIAKIGTQIWMAQNLNRNVSGSLCNKNLLANCEMYGRLYDWTTAMNINQTYQNTLYNKTGTFQGICPEGWHLPSKAEWNTLVSFAGGVAAASTKLRANSDWESISSYGSGTDNYNFSALPGGYGNSDGTFGSVGYRGYWWTSSESSNTGAYGYGLHYDHDLDVDGYPKNGFQSVRCINNNANTSVSSSSSVTPSSSSSRIIYGEDVVYEGVTYKTVKIGTQTWFQRNLNYAATGSKCGSGSSLSDANTSTCDSYGRLYNWETALRVCPTGWHLPDSEDWDKLFRYADGTNGTDILYDSEEAGYYLKAATGWASNGNGSDIFGFAALPGGYGTSGGSFINVGKEGNWWSSDYYDGELEDWQGMVFYRYMDYSGTFAYWEIDKREFLFSVRCLKN